MAKTMNIRQKQRARRPMRKSAITKSIFVVKDGVRKARSIRKFQDTYYVGLAYVGLMQLDKGVDEGGNTCWDGQMKVENPISDITVYVTVYNKLKEYSANYIKDNYYKRDGYYVNEDWEDSTHYSPETIDLWRNNMEGISESLFKYEIWYYADSLDGSNSRDRIFKYESDYTYYSIEDVLDAVAQKSEEAWGEVNIYLNDHAKTYQNIKDSEKLYPSTISLMLPNGESLALSMRDSYGTKMGNWSGVKSFNQDGIFAEVKVNIRAVTSDENGVFSDESRDFSRYPTAYSVNRDNPLEYYAVDVNGTITDGNTQMSPNRGEYEQRESWERNFTGEGSQTLEGAIAIAESNIAEVYNEWTEYINSARNYVQVGHGVGHRRTTENTESWDYNFGDTRDDMSYDHWQGYDLQSDAPISIPGTEWDEGWSYAIDDQDFYVFINEYVGDENAHYFGVDGDGNVGSRWSGDEKNVARVTQGKTREDVERVANFMGLKLLDYENPYTFRLGKGMKKRVRKSKMPYAYYDVEVRRLQRQGLVKSKQAQPKSFNDMVKSIRAKNNQHKRRM